MSYILDALRKADAQRERDASRGIHAQSVPLGTRSAAGEGRPAWTWAVIAAAAAAVVAGGWFVLRGSGPHEGAQAAAAPAPVIAAAPAQAPSAQAVPAPAPAPATAVLPPPAAPIVGTPPAGRTVPQRDIANPALQNPRAALAASSVIPELPPSVRAAQAREQAMARAAGAHAGPQSGLMPHGAGAAGRSSGAAPIQVAQVGGMPQQGPSTAPVQPGVAPQPGVTPQTGAAQPGAAQPATAQPGTAQPGAAQPGVSQPSAAQPAAAPPAAAQPSIPAPSVATQPAVPSQQRQPTGTSLPPAAPSNAPAPQAVGLPSDAPKLSIGGGVYSANPTQRMLIVNGQVFNEGSEVAPGVVLQAIQPKTAVVRFRGGTYTLTY